jgi:hypothetical protein
MNLLPDGFRRLRTKTHRNFALYGTTLGLAGCYACRDSQPRGTSPMTASALPSLGPFSFGRATALGQSAAAPSATGKKINICRHGLQAKVRPSSFIGSSQTGHCAVRAGTERPISASVPRAAERPLSQTCNKRHQLNSGLSRPCGSVTKIRLCPSTGCRDMCPFPYVASTSTELPAETRRNSPSLVSNSTMPSSHTASTRPGGIFQPALRTPAGTCTKRIRDAG